MKKMNLACSIIFFLLISCAQLSEKKIVGNDTTTTVEAIDNTNQSVTVVEKQNKKEEFLPHTVKANRNKKISIFLGKLEDRMFYAIGVLKWLENNGYKISKIQTTSSEEEGLFFDLKINRKTSYIEWKLHQCCKDIFPFETSDSYKEILEQLETRVILPSYAQDQRGCEDFSSDSDRDQVLCILSGENNKVVISDNKYGFKKFEIFLGPVNYSEKLSLVDYIDNGHTLAKEIKK